MAPSYDQLNVGDEIPRLAVTLDQMMLWMYAGASLDFNPIHVDKEVGEKAGLGGTIAHGLSNMARLGRCITDWLEDPGALKQFKVRMRNPARPGRHDHVLGESGRQEGGRRPEAGHARGRGRQPGRRPDTRERDGHRRALRTAFPRPVRNGLRPDAAFSLSDPGRGV